MPGGIVAPEIYPIRDPRDKQQLVGRIMNPPRFMEVGGLGNAGRWNEDNLPHSQSAQKYIGQLESGGPTGVKVARKSTNVND